MSLIDDRLAHECKIGMTWRVKEDVLKDALLKKESIKSEKFYASKMSGVKYNLSAEMDDEDPAKVMIYLELEYHIIKKIIGNCTFVVKSATYEFKSCDFSDSSGSSGWGDELCKMDELFEPEKKFFVDGYMVIELEGKLKAEGGIKRKAAKLASLCQLLWEREDDKDVTVIADQKEIKAHKWILCDRSPVFQAAMEIGMKEALENKIVIANFSFETVRLALEYFYERDIKELINEKNASELIHFADMYDVAPLHDMIQNVLIGKLSDTNVCEFANISTTSNAHKLRECSISFLMNSTDKASNDLVKLKPEITTEICRRSFLSTSA